ncbi:MAG: 1,4-dihydroxy-2-naphthoate octaprenyltransferase [Candidatus Omnitrophota bacterium]
MRNISIWIKAARAPFFTATIIPVSVGTLLAWHAAGVFLWARFALAMAGAILVHAGTNLANDYFDHRSGNDEANRNPTPFSGGSRMIQNGLIPAKNILAASLLTFGAGALIGLYLNSILKGNVVLFLGVIGVFLGFFYTAGPVSIGYRSFGEIAVGVGFGPLMVLGAYYVQAEHLTLPVFFVSVPIGLLIALVVFINEFPDYDADKSVGKKTVVVLLGKKRAITLYRALLGSVYICIAALIALKALPLICGIVFLTIPLAIKAFVVSRNNYEKIYELLPANAATIGLHSLIGILIGVGVILDRVLF